MTLENRQGGIRYSTVLFTTGIVSHWNVPGSRTLAHHLTISSTLETGRTGGNDWSCVYYELEVLGVMLSSDHPAGNSTLLKSLINLVWRDRLGYIYIYSRVLAIFEGQKEACRHFIEKLN